LKILRKPFFVGRCPRGLKRRFYGTVIVIAWSWFNSYPRRVRCCVLR